MSENEEETQQAPEEEKGEDERRMDYDIPRDVASGLVNNSRTNFKFKFDGLLGMEATQEEVFDAVGKPGVQNALDGFNSTIFAYGQTGSGKTFTITGGAERYVDRGLIPRSLSMIFNEAKSKTDLQLSVYISYLEIYNNQGFDLLDENRGASKLEDLPRVTMLEDEDGNCHLRNLSMHRANTEEEALNLLFIGDTNRAVSETAMNLASSRSHCIFTVSIESRRAGNERILRSKLHLVDLAGSERAHKTGAHGQVLREAKYINASLHFLEMVIVALYERSKGGRGHIPYRNSMMTSVLRDSLGGNCKTTMIATVSAEEEQTDESVSTCRFAQRVARVKNDAHLNEELDPSIIIKRLKGEIAALKEEIRFLKGEASEGDDLSDRELERLKQKCLNYVLDKDPESTLAVGELTYTRIRLCFALIKQCALELGNGSDGDTTNQATGRGNGSTEQRAKIAQLEECLQQRNNEIAILVNMVKQGKNVSLSDLPTPLDGKAAAPPPVNNNAVKIQVDPAVLDDPTKAFEAFSQQYPKNHIIAENKQILKQKYALAKRTAQEVNDARKNIDSQKRLIEKIRKERALEGIVNRDEQDDGSEAEESREEIEAKQVIADEKQAYKASYQKLRELKSEIEQIQKLLERSRQKLQKDFDSWYETQGRGETLTKALVETNTHFKTPHIETDSPRREAIEIKQAWASPTDTSSTTSGSTATTTTTTGYRDTDDDIAAFYKANELLRARRAKKSNN